MLRKLLLLIPLFAVLQAMADQPSRLDTVISTMDEEERAAQLIMVYFSSPGFVAEQGFGAVLLMQNMIKDLDSLSARLHTLQQRSRIGVLVAVDQEGGRVNRLKHLPEWRDLPSATAMGRWPLERIESEGRRVARLLKRIGIHMNLAPVLDPSHDHQGNPTLIGNEQRAFGRESAAIAARSRAFIEGFRSQRVLTIVKHFPGYDVAQHSDHEIAVSHATRQQIAANTEPFRAVAPLVDGVMISSIRYARLAADPAVLSPRMVAWARKIYPDRLIVTDDLWGVALRRWINPAAYGKEYPDADLLKLVRMTLDAGNDLLMITYPEKALLMKRAIAGWMRTDPRLRARVDRSVRRILAAKARAGLL